MELAEKTVLDLLMEEEKKDRRLSEHEILKILKDVLLGLKEMHGHNIYHQDVKV